MSYSSLWYASILVLNVPSLVFAQFSQLTATDDGQQVCFTSRLVFKGSTTPVPTLESRLYCLRPTGVSLTAQRGSLAAKPVLYDTPGVALPQISGDGIQLAFTFHNICTGSTGCVPSDTEGMLQGKQNLDLGPGSIQLSGNGQWALLAPTPSGAPQTATLVNLVTGQRTVVPHPSGLVRHAVTSNGTVLVVSQDLTGGETGAFSLWTQGQQTPLPLGDPAWSLWLSDDGTTLISGDPQSGWQTDPVPVLTATDLASRRSTTLFKSPDDRQLAVLMGVSNDGVRVLYRRGVDYDFAGAAYIADTRTGRSQLIELPAGESVTDGTLNGPGTVVFLVTTNGRLLRIMLASGLIEEMIPATPYSELLDEVVAGSIVHIRGSLVGAAAEWKGRILLNDQPVPILYTRPGEVAIQAPWEVPFRSVPFQMEPVSASPFHQLRMVDVHLVAPDFETPAPGASTIFPIIMIRSDWSGLLEQLPQPGDVVYLYMRGLGPVTGSVQTGLPASLTSVNPIRAQITCQFDPQSRPAEILFAGLAPGMIGIYQVAVRMPADAGASPIGDARCTACYGELSGVIFGFGGQ